ncbi:MAG: hypothetical protein ACRD5M_16220 [Candidatus Acidiferrales bacterium]
MERNIVHWSYWLGIASLVIALLWRAFNAVGMWLPKNIAPGNTIYYMSFYKAALIFFVAAIASASYASFKAHRA